MWKWLIVFLIVLLLASGAYQLIKNTKDTREKALVLSEKAAALEKENSELNGQLKYLANPENLLKEVKSRFNYRREGEKLIIIVPKEEE
ncbi:MAG: septum formation initiator family protein [bacterium]|nr:septum formation initiator family protein [bacterium]